MMNACLSAIKIKYDSLTNAEKKIADYVLKNSSAVVNMTADELSIKSGTAKSAVIRCCKSLGFEGYSQFKMALAMELTKNENFNYIPYIYPEDETGEIINKVFSANIKTLHETMEKIDRKKISEVVKLLASAKTIYIYGVGTSSAIANDFQYRLMLFGRNAICYTDAPTMKISTLNIKEGDVAIGISHSGRTKATVDTLKLAGENGAKTVCITSYPESDITSVCDYSIEIHSDEIQYPIEAISARIAHLSVIEAITIALSSENYDEASERSKKSHELINTLRYGK